MVRTKMEVLDKEIVTGAVSLGVGLGVGRYVKDVSWIIIALMAFIIIDVLTGLLKAWKDGDLSSTKSREGVIHKSSELIALLAGFGMDLVLPRIIQELTGRQIDFKIFGLTIAAYLILTEILSIVENLSATGVILPDVLVSRLRTYKSDIEGKKDNQPE